MLLRQFRRSLQIKKNYKRCWSCVCVCVCVCVCICVCMCMCLYFSTVTASSDCKTSVTYLKGTDQRCCVVSIIPVASNRFLHLRVCKSHISPPKTKTPAHSKLERKLYDILMAGKKMIYTDIGFKSTQNQNRQATKIY